MPARYYGYKKPSTANAKPATTAPIVATGQWAPGALSQADTRTTTQSVADRNVTHFTDLGGGKTGSLVDMPVTDLNQATPAFAQKAQQALAQEALSQQQIPQGVPAQVANPAGALPFAPNTNNPFAPNFSGTTPSQPFEQTAGAEGTNQVIHANPPNAFSAENLMGAATMLSAGGAEIGLGIATQAISYIAGLGGGSWLAGIKSLMPTGTRGALSTGTTDDWVSASLKETMTGVVTKEITKNGGAKTMNTIKTMVSKWFTQDKITAYVTESGRLRYKTLKVSTLTPTNVLKAVGVAGGVAAFVTYLTVNGKTGQSTGTRDRDEELVGYLGMISNDMFRNGDYEKGNLFLDMIEDAPRETLSAMPGGKGSIQGSGIYLNTVKETIPMLREHYALMEQMEAENMTPEQTADFWTKYNVNKNAMDEASNKREVDYFNSEQLKTQQEIAAARSKSNSSERAADKKAAEELAAFWLDYQKKLAALEEEQMKKSAEYWLNYRKMVIKIQEETGRSRLGFGLFR